MLNTIRWYTLIAFKEDLNEKQVHHNFSRRYHVTEAFLQSIFRALFVDGDTIPKHLQKITRDYASWARDKWLNVHNCEELEYKAIHDECKQFYQTRTFQLCIKEFLLGYLVKENLKLEAELDKTIQIDLYADAAHSFVQHIFDQNTGNRKNKINVTQLHIQNWQTFLRGQFRLLPNGGESYDIMLDEMADIITKNLMNAVKCPQGWNNYQFHHCINIDRGTLANPDIIRNFLVYKIKEKLGMSQKQEIYSNIHTGRTYDFRKYYVSVSQELYHLVIRCRGIWNYLHADCWAVKRGLTQVTKRLQYKYNKYKHACYLEGRDGTKYDPYQLVSKLSPLQDDIQFSCIQSIILKYLKLQKTYNATLKKQLNHEIDHTKLWERNDPNSNIPNRGPRQIVADLLYALYTNVTENHLGHIESVGYF